MAMRKPAVVRGEHDRLWDKVWWNRHMSDHVNHDCNSIHFPGCHKALEIEKRWGRAALDPGDDIQWGITIGQFTALGWVMGAEWDEAGDT